MEKKRTRELTDKDLEQATGGSRPIAGGSPSGYYQCPECKFKSADSNDVYARKSGFRFYCRHCGFVGRVNTFNFKE